MKKERHLIALMGTYSAILMCLCIISISVIFSKKEKTPTESIIETIIQTEEVYLFIDTPDISASETRRQSTLYIVCEYNEKIAVFDTEGKLIKTLDIYTKTLPKADQALLREGIKLTSEEELTALIEDYSS